MATFKSFEEIEAWKEARKLTSEICSVSGDGKLATDFALRNQILRACISIMSNIAEGFERGSKAEFAHFLTIAKGPTGEVKAQLYIAFDQEYLTKETFENLTRTADHVGRMIGKLISYLRSEKAAATTRSQR